MYQLDVLEALGFEWYSLEDANNNQPMSSLDIRRATISQFSKMRSVYSESNVQPVSAGDINHLHMREGKYAIFGGSLHGKSSFVRANANAAEVEMEPSLARQRFGKDIEDIVTQYEGNSSDYDLFEVMTDDLMNSDIDIICSHLGGALLDSAIQSGRKIAFVFPDWTVIKQRAIEDDNPSRAGSAFGYSQNLVHLNIAGPFHPTFDAALSSLQGEVSGPDIPDTQEIPEGD